MNFHSDEWILDKVEKHYEEAVELLGEGRVVGVFYQGSGNYGLDYAGSDVDTKCLVIPTLDELARGDQPTSITHVRENDEHIDLKDVRILFQVFLKHNINFIETDVSNPDSIKESIRKVYNKEGQIDVLINNAGIGLTGAVEELLTTDIVKVMNTNFLGTVSACQAVIPFMREHRKGKIINVSCTLASNAPAFNSIYSASKKALETVTIALRKEIEPLKIEVTSVLLPTCKTNFTENRIKQDSTNKAYRYRISNDIGRLEYAEQTGIQPETIAEELYRISNKKSFGANAITIKGKNRVRAFFGKLVSKK